MKIENQIHLIKLLLVVAIFLSLLTAIVFWVNAQIKYEIFKELQKNGVKNFMNCITECKATVINPDYPLFNFS